MVRFRALKTDCKCLGVDLRWVLIHFAITMGWSQFEAGWPPPKMPSE